MLRIGPGQLDPAAPMAADVVRQQDFSAGMIGQRLFKQQLVVDPVAQYHLRRNLTPAGTRQVELRQEGR